jgi:YesN/AraC family two-component response regulator
MSAGASGQRILVVENEAWVRELLKTVLASYGYEVMEAENGFQGLQLAKQQPCDLIITDQIMPLLNGLDMISRLAAERYPARYLLISGYGANQRIPRGLSFLQKPFTTSQLIDAIKRLQDQPTLAELERAYHLAEREWQESVSEMEEILSDVPSQIPHPDGALRIERAAFKRRTTYDRYFHASRKYKEALQACGVWDALTESQIQWAAPMNDSANPRPTSLGQGGAHIHKASSLAKVSTKASASSGLASLRRCRPGLLSRTSWPLPLMW